MQNELIMKYPSTWHQEMWREGAPFGNGLIGGMVYGGIYKENILLNHAFLWRGGRTEEMPDVHEAVAKARYLLRQKKPVEADRCISDAFREAGYAPEFMVPGIVCDLTFETLPTEVFSHYRRRIRMDKAEVEVRWQEGELEFARSVFASRANQLVFTRFDCDRRRIHTKLALKPHDLETLGDMDLPEGITCFENDMLYYSAANVSDYRPGDYGAVSRIFTDGKLLPAGDGVEIVEASRILVVTGIFVGMDREKAFEEIAGNLRRNFDYEEELEAHRKLHNPLFETTTFSISEQAEHHSNEELLLDAYEEKASLELIEKLYAYGRYLFVCSTAEKGSLPCHLTGLFNGNYQCMWAFYMYNINFQMIYWHTLSGNLPAFLRAALDYTEAFLPDFRENARKVYGCRGILINSVNTPESGLFKCLANHIVNWTGGAAWISQHFWDYYRYTLDEVYLREHALPFMYETALFYEDFAMEAEDGYYDLYPSVSPENVPGNVRKATPPELFVETSVNATMETALLKELLTHLIQGSEITDMYEDKREKWKGMLKKIRPYRVNGDGALSEWIDDFYEDNYQHRHHSHLYPVFPGHEITKDHPLYPAAVRAEDMRLAYGLSDQSGWSLLMMAGIAARMERGELAAQCFSTLSRSCLMGNLLAVHNDWRRMGPACCGDVRSAPFQIDGNIGFPAIIHEMLLQCDEDWVKVLPALPKEWKHGSVQGLLLIGNIRCDLKWDEDRLSVRFYAELAQERQVRLGSGYSFPGQTAVRRMTIQNMVTLTAERELPYQSGQEGH